MNDRAREVLVAASLRGQRQIKGHLRDADGRCALGVLYDEAGEPLATESFHSLMRCFDLTWEEGEEIVDANDRKGWDFLTIARKCCLPNQPTEEGIQ